jgi:hypothetical protein
MTLREEIFRRKHRVGPGSALTMLVLRSSSSTNVFEHVLPGLQTGR